MSKSISDKSHTFPAYNAKIVFHTIKHGATFRIKREEREGHVLSLNARVTSLAFFKCESRFFFKCKSGISTNASAA